MTPQELKNSILQLAIQGRLVEQRPEEGTAEELYQQIQKEKQQLIQAGKIKKEKPLPEIAEDEMPFDIPESWKWVRLGTIGYTNIGLTYSPKDTTTDGTIVLRSSNIQDGKMDYADIVRVKIAIPENKMCHKGDILICARNGSKRLVGKSAIVNTDGMGFGAFMAIFRSPYNKYIFHVINSAYFRNSLLSDTGTTTINQITQDILKNFLVPLPPSAEQKRIVAKIEELLPYIDRYEQAWSRLEDFNKRFPADMKKSILQLAMQGKLVEQRPEDGTAEELYRQIQEERQRFIKSGKIKNGKTLPAISEKEHPFDIPKTWKWVRLGNIISISSGDPLTSSEMDKDGNYPVYGGNGITGYHCAFNVLKRTLVIGRVGFYCGSTHITEKYAWVTDNAFITTFSEQLVSIKWLKYFIDYLEPRKKASSTAQPVISGKLIYPMLMPLPPLAEQKRIVTKLEELLPLCERLK